MADNYLEKRYEEVFGGGGRRTVKRGGPSLDSLLLRNRSHRGYLKEQVVTEAQLKTVIGVNDKIPSGRNGQVLRFRPVTRDTGADIVLSHIRLGAALPDLHLPFPGTEPEAFIIICSTVPEDRIVDIDLGISFQSMALKAVETGLNAIAVAAFDRTALKADLDLPLDPLLVVAVGKGTDKIQLTRIAPDDCHDYYRKDNIHYVPKLGLEDLII